jgi:hypothetical protein
MPHTDKQNEENSPAVLAYRVGRLEIAVADGFRELKEELSNQAILYATKVELADAKAHSHDEHARIDANIAVIQKWMEWATKIVIGSVLVAILALVVGTQALK